MTVVDKIFNVRVEYEKLFVWLKEYIQYQRDDFLKMDTVQFFLLVSEAERRHEQKIAQMNKANLKGRSNPRH